MQVEKLKHNIQPGGPMIWFTSDTHYSHTNICRGVTRWKNATEVTRDFQNVPNMNYAIVSSINEHVQQDDILFHLGDWSFGGYEQIEEFRSKIICKNIHLILGNHDEHIAKNQFGIQDLFSSVSLYKEMTIQSGNDSMDLVLMHYPIQSWNNLTKGAVHLHGHVHLPHNKKLGRGRMLDVGVDGNDLKPYSFKDIQHIMKQQPTRANFNFDHHVKSKE